MSAGPAPALFRPTRLTVLRLMTGRAVFRGSQLLSALGLQVSWGTERFAQYAAALASAGWLTAVATAGGEKTLIALLPRPGGSGVGRLIVRATLLWLAAVTGAAGLAVVEPGLRIWAAAAVYGAGLGAMFVFVTVLRLAGRWRFDPLAMVLLGCAHVAAVLAAAAGWRPEAVLAVLGVVAAGGAVAIGSLAWRSTSAAADDRRPPVLSEVLLTGSSEIANMVAVAVVFALLAASRYADQAGDLFLVGIAGQMAIGATAYLVRLTGASHSWEAYVAGHAAKRSTARRLYRCAFVSLLHLFAIGAVVLAAESAGVSERTVVVVTAALAVPPTLITLRACAMAEFGSRSGRRSAAIGSAVGQLGGCLLAVALVPLAGAPGGAFSLVAGVTGQGLLAGWLLDRRARRSRKRTGSRQ